MEKARLHRENDERGADAIYSVITTPINLTVPRPSLHVLSTSGKISITYHFHELPVELFPHHFIKYLINFSVEKMSPLFGHNLGGQRIYQSRIHGAVGKLGYAIQQELFEYLLLERDTPAIFHRKG
jgi:hypothetical protein